MNCVLCGVPVGNEMVGADDGLMHPLCFYKREYDRPRDEVIAELRQSLRMLRSRIHETTPCPVCEWPLPADTDHEICPCCGTHLSYEDAAPTEELRHEALARLRDRWIASGAQFWARDIERAPLIVRLHAAQSPAAREAQADASDSTVNDGETQTELVRDRRS